MKMIRIRNVSNEFNEMVGPFLNFVGVPKDQTLSLVHALLSDFPEHVLVVVATNKVKTDPEATATEFDEVLVGFVIAQAAVDGESVLILQLKADDGDLISRLLKCTRQWAETGKRRFIRVIVKSDDVDIYKNLEFKNEAFQMLLKLEKEDELLYEDDNAAPASAQPESVRESKTSSPRVVVSDVGGDISRSDPLDGAKAGPAPSTPSNGQ